jgi:hypothetical protein
LFQPKGEKMLKHDFEMYKKADGGLYLYRFGQEEEVLIIPSFPWSSPGEYLSLRNKEGVELLFIESLDDLSPDHRVIVEESLGQRGFVLEIVKIEKVEDEVELRRFKVVTISGPRVFHTKLEDWPEVRTDGVILIHDIFGDLYQISNWRDLDANSVEEISVLVA